MSKQKLAFFDIDGTIVRSSLTIELYFSLIREGIFPATMKTEIQQEYQAWLNRQGTYEEYENTLAQLFDREIEGKKQSDVVAVSKKVVSELRNRVYRYTRDLLHDIRNEYYLVAISGSLIELLREFQEYWPFDEVYGTLFPVDDRGFYSYDGAIHPTDNKKYYVEHVLRKRGLTLEGSIGVGDTGSDTSFLSTVERPIAFNPNHALYQEAKHRGWSIVVERKDVIYKIQ